MMRLRTSRRLALFLLVSALIALGAGAALALHSTRDPVPAVLPLTYAKTVAERPSRRLVAQAQTPTEILQFLITRLGSRAVLKGTIGETPPEYRATEDPNPPADLPAFTQPWVHLTIQAPDEGLNSILPMWHANLLVGDLREEMHALDPSNPLFGEAIDLVANTGKTVATVDTNIGDIAYGQVFSDASDLAIESSIRAAAATAGLSVKSITIFHGLDPAPAVVVATKDPADFLQDADASQNAIFGGSPMTYEGVYLEVVDTSGSPVLVTSSSFRTGIGGSWIRPGLHPSTGPTDDGSPLPDSGAAPNG